MGKHTNRRRNAIEAANLHTPSSAAGERTSADHPRISISLSGGGYRATAFSTGALLALANSTAREHVKSISAVSGGSIAAALFTGTMGSGTVDPNTSARVLAGLVTCNYMRTERLIGRAVTVLIALVLTIIFGVAGYWFWSGSLSAILPGQTRNLIYVTGTIICGVGAAFAVSSSAIQAALEVLLKRLQPVQYITSKEMHIKPAQVTQLYCATDISTGEHVYLSEHSVLCVNQPPLDRANLTLPDIVAASAGFPGFRPLTFSARQIGLEGPDTAPRRMQAEPMTGVIARTVTGMLGVTFLLVAVAIYLARCVGALPGTFGLVMSIIVIVVALGSSLLCANWLSQQPGQLHLVDGGVCDNLGTPFALLTNDERYPNLDVRLFGPSADDDPHALGHAKILLVADASKPLSDAPLNARWFEAFVPFRLRILSRTAIGLVNNANVTARKRAIARLLELDATRSGKVLSISDRPLAPSEGSKYWASATNRNLRVPTSLKALAPETASELIMHGYRLMEQALEDRSFQAIKTMNRQDFDALVSPASRKEVIRQLRQWPTGPASRRQFIAKLIFPLWIFLIVVSEMVFACPGTCFS